MAELFWIKGLFVPHCKVIQILTMFTTLVRQMNSHEVYILIIVLHRFYVFQIGGKYFILILEINF